MAPWILLESLPGANMPGARPSYIKNLALLATIALLVSRFVWETLMTTRVSSGTHRCFDDVSKTHFCRQNASVTSN